MALVFTDMVGSVDLKRRLGDAAFAEMLRRHDELFKATVGVTADYVKDTGDGFLATCGSASAAVNAALAFQHALAREPFQNPLRVRVGIHLGEVSELDMEASGIPKLSGLAVDVAGRIMSLASGGQILLTKAAFDGAKQYVRAHPPVGAGHGEGQGDGQEEGFDLPDIRWQAHGLYMFRGLDEPVEVFEVGAVGIAPLSQPPDSEKVHRAVTLGPRPTRGRGWPAMKNLMTAAVLLGVAAGGVYFARDVLGVRLAIAGAGGGPPTLSMAGAARNPARIDPPTGAGAAIAQPPPKPGPSQPRDQPATGPRPDPAREARRAPPPPPPRAEDRPREPAGEGPLGLAQVRMEPAPRAGQRPRIVGCVLNRAEYARLRLRIRAPQGLPDPAYDLRVDAMMVAQQLRDALAVEGLEQVQVSLTAAETGAGAAAIKLTPPPGTPPEDVERAKRTAERFVLDDRLVELTPAG